MFHHWNVRLLMLLETCWAKCSRQLLPPFLAWKKLGKKCNITSYVLEEDKMNKKLVITYVTSLVTNTNLEEEKN